MCPFPVLYADTDIKVRFSNNLAHSIAGQSTVLAICLLRRESGGESPISPDEWIRDVVARRAAPLGEEEENARAAARDMLRHGKYKPTGRGKPASEYLLNYARREGQIPRVNAIVDVANSISLEYVVPISVWDADRVNAAEYVFRTGTDDESYVFNTAGQLIELAGLVCGCAVEYPGGPGRPCVTPVKDSMTTKTSDASKYIGFVIYAPGQVFSRERLWGILDHVGRAYAEYTTFSVVGSTVVDPGESETIVVEPES